MSGLEQTSNAIATTTVTPIVTPVSKTIPVGPIDTAGTVTIASSVLTLSDLGRSTTAIMSLTSTSTNPSPSSLIAAEPLTATMQTSFPLGSPALIPDSSNNASSTPNHSHSAGIIAGAVIGSLFMLSAGIGVFMVVYCRLKRQRRGVPGHISPLEQNTHEYGLGASDIDIIPSGITSPSREKGHRIQTNYTPVPQAEAAAISISGNPQSNSALTLDNVDQDDVRVKVVRMEAAFGRMVEHMHRLESQLEWTGDGHSDAPPPTYVSS
ncbi:hypothetical protein BDP27DRAFT_1426169 [Rhodocollybia butyracea]|uniref:Uncharacterized protein n=1 Tax=Rhodocollybia butyracea TaxID=206335 RepID=A0A9P5U322_9AGAR|nr:hypothetical protein BDP27DRAFT_1426169 [Rhodocollybia butyracea]